jgi:hypothetical protein
VVVPSLTVIPDMQTYTMLDGHRVRHSSGDITDVVELDAAQVLNAMLLGLLDEHSAATATTIAATTDEGLRTGSNASPTTRPRHCRVPRRRLADAAGRQAVPTFCRLDVWP